jgi:hypothetical protein
MHDVSSEHQVELIGLRVRLHDSRFFPRFKLGDAPFASL